MLPNILFPFDINALNNFRNYRLVNRISIDRNMFMMFKY